MTQQEVIKAFNQSLDNTTLSGRAALDEAIRASSGFANFEELKKKFLNDQREAKSWHRFLVEKCGIILDNADTGAISGSDAGGTEKTATTVIPSTGTAKYPTGTSFTVRGLTIYGIPPKDTLTADQQYVIKGLYSWWIRDSLKLIKESYGYSYTAADATNSRMKLKFIDDENSDTLAYVQPSPEDGKKNESRVLCVNMANFKNMKSTDRHGSTGTMNLDRTIVHELVHGIMASNVDYFNDLPGFLIEGGTAELIHGIDDERYENIIAYAKDPKVFEKILSPVFNESAREVYAGGYIFMRYFAKQAAADTTFDYDTYRKTVSIGSNGGFATNYWDVVTMKGGGGYDIITNSGEDVFISTGAKADIIKNYAENVTINAGSGSDEILNEGAQASIVGGTGSDDIKSYGDKVTINAGTGNDEIKNYGLSSSINGGTGNDFIINEILSVDTIAGLTLEEISTGVKTADDSIAWIATGDATLSAYSVELSGGNNSTLLGGAGNDSLCNYSDKAKLYGDDGSDAIENYGYRSTVYGGAGNDIILNGNATIDAMVEGLSVDATVSVDGGSSKIYGGDGNDSITNESFKAKIYGEGGMDSISNSSSDVSVYGGADNDYISNNGKSSYLSGGNGNDGFNNFGNSVSLSGGAGNDYFFNDSEESMLLGGDGNDEILNFGDFNSLSGGAGKDTIYSSGEAATILGGSGTDYIYNEGVKVIINGGSGKDTINNDGDYVTISGGTGNDSITNYGGKHNVYQFGTGYGKDTIVGFTDGDTVQIMEGSYTSKKSGNNIIINVGTDRLTLRNAADKTINLVLPTTETLASDSSSAISNDKISNTLWGSAGNDNLYGTSNDDTFIYTTNEGTDTIFDYSSNDMLQILNADGSYGSFKNSKYSGGDLTLTIDGGGSVIFNGVSAGDKFNINNKTYTLGSKKLK